MAKGKRGSLKAALSSQQHRLKKKQEAAQAAQVAEQKGKRQSGVKGKEKERVEPKFVNPFDATDRILLIGEGNFSFTRALVVDAPASLQYLPPQNIISTAYDSEEDCYAKYSDAQTIVAMLREKGVEVIFEVDATKLDKCIALRGRKFDKVVWNFPHAG